MKKKNKLTKINDKTKIKNSDISLKKIKQKKLIQKYLKWVNDKTITKFTELKKIKISLKILQNYIIEKNNSKNEFLFGIFYKKHYIGNIKIGPINIKLNSAPIGYIIGDKLFWNRGVATIAIKKIVNFGFTKLKLKYITSNSEIKNLFSSRALITNNFKKIKKEINKNRKLFLYSIKNPNK